MAESTADQQQIEAARSAGAKLQTLLEELTPDEQQALDGALRHIGAATAEGAADASGYLGPPLVGIAVLQQMAITDLINTVREFLSGARPARSP